jgi:energy-coupling factor transport system ATP-binding protein
MPETIIECQELWHIYPGGVTALQHANLTINSGEIVGVIGQNGSGKTTLVKHFNGLLKPTLGKVLVKGKDTAQLRIQQLAATVGYVFQNPNHQLFAKTVEEELEFGPRNLGVPNDEVIERREKAIEFFNLQELRYQHPYRIGFPLRKLVGMASIYTMRPDVFILDEPTTGQDNITTRIVYRLIERLRDEGSTIVCVAHDMILLAEVVERMVVLRNSSIIADTTPREVFSNRELMSSTHLTPPQIAELSLRLAEKNQMDGIHLSVAEMVETLDKRMRSGQQFLEVEK